MPQERKVLQIKYAAKPFSQLSELEQDAHSLGLLLKINVVTGWPVPDSNETQNILAEQLKLYLIENWPLYNVEEIMYAMRSYATVIENWGKNMNLSLIGKAMTDYENERADISKLEESKSREPQSTNLIEMKADWKPLYEIYYQDYLKGKFNIRVMPWEIYNAAVECGNMAEDAFEEWIDLAQAKIIAWLMIEKNEAASENEKHDLSERIRKIESGELTFKVTEMAKKLAVELLYKTAKEKGYKKLFEKI